MTTDTTIGCPDQLIDPSLKGKDWCIRNLKYIYADYAQKGGVSYALFLLKQKMADNRSYSQGIQSSLRYKKLMGCDDQGQSYMNINWEVPKIWSKYRDIVHSLLEKY